MEQKVLSASEKEKEILFVQELTTAVYENFRRQALSRLCYDDEAADDCMLSMYEIAVKKAHVLATHPKPEAWLAKVLQNCIRRKIQKLMKSPEKKITFVNIDLVADFLPDPRNVEYADETDDKQIEKAKEYILSQLTEAEREVYELRYTHGRSIAETAKTVGISEDAVRARLHRVKLKAERLAKNIFSEQA